MQQGISGLKKLIINGLWLTLKVIYSSPMELPMFEWQNTTTFTGIDFKNDKVRSLDPEEVTPEDSKGMVKLAKEITNTAYVAYPERHKMFLELPRL